MALSLASLSSPQVVTASWQSGIAPPSSRLQPADADHLVIAVELVGVVRVLDHAGWPLPWRRSKTKPS